MAFLQRHQICMQTQYSSCLVISETDEGLYTTDRNLFNKTMKQSKRQKVRSNPYSAYQQRPAFKNKSSYNTYNPYQTNGGNLGNHYLSLDSYSSSSESTGYNALPNTSPNQVSQNPGFFKVDSCEATVSQNKTYEPRRDIDKMSKSDGPIIPPKRQASAMSSMSVPVTSKWAKFVSTPAQNESSSDEEENEEQLRDMLAKHRQETALFTSNRDDISVSAEVAPLMPAGNIPYPSFESKGVGNLDKNQMFASGADFQKENRNLFSLDSDDELDDILSNM